MIRRISALAAVALLTVSCTGGPTINDGTVVAIKITPDNPQVSAGDDLAFVATAIQVNGVARVVTELPGTTWASSDSSIVQINADGTGHANAEGDAYVTASRDGLTSPPQHVTVVTPPASPSPTPTPPPSNHVLISEVMFNPKTEPDGQYVEVFNPTPNPINITGWVLTYNSSGGVSFTFPALTLGSAQFAVAANTPALFDGVTYPPVANLYSWPMANLSNTGDWFILKDNTGVIVDQMAYGSGFGATHLKPAGWCASNNPVAGDGQAVARHPTAADSDSCSDWASNVSTPTPGQQNP